MCCDQSLVSFFLPVVLFCVSALEISSSDIHSAGDHSEERSAGLSIVFDILLGESPYHQAAAESDDDDSGGVVVPMTALAKDWS